MGSWAAIFIRLTVLSIPPFPDYNAQDVVARTLVRPPTGMPPGRNGRRGVPGLEPGPPRGRAGARRGRAESPARGGRPGGRVPGGRAGRGGGPGPRRPAGGGY